MFKVFGVWKQFQTDLGLSGVLLWLDDLYKLIYVLVKAPPPPVFEQEAVQTCRETMGDEMFLNTSLHSCSNLACAWPLKLIRRGRKRNPSWLAMRRINLIEAPPTAESDMTANWPTASLSRSRMESSVRLGRKPLQKVDVNPNPFSKLENV